MIINSIINIVIFVFHGISIGSANSRVISISKIINKIINKKNRIENGFRG